MGALTPGGWGRGRGLPTFNLQPDEEFRPVPVGGVAPGVPPLSRRGMGTAGYRRRRHLREALPRGVPGGAVVADDPPQTGGLPGWVRTVRPRCGGRVRA